MGLDLYIIMMEGVVELLHSARTWYSGGAEDISKLNTMMESYISNYMSNILGDSITASSEEAGDLGETTYS